jgi:hypothetical protein
MLFYFGLTVFTAGVVLSFCSRVWALVPMCSLIFAVVFAARPENITMLATVGYCVLAAVIMQLGYFLGLFGRHIASAPEQPQPKEGLCQMSKSGSRSV